MRFLQKDSHFAIALLNLGILAAFLLVMCYKSQEKVIIHTKYGDLIGRVKDIDNGESMVYVYGVPYAQPPIGKLRFEKSRTPTPWTDPIDGFDQRVACLFYAVENESEDCLYMDILAPYAPPPDDEGYPVYLEVVSSAFFPQNRKRGLSTSGYVDLVKKGVIYIHFTYRIGAFGFLTTGNDQLEGNYALSDILQALRFTREIISEFGGDPNRIAVVGSSSGAANAAYLGLMPEAQGLYSQTVLASGGTQNLWTNSDEVFVNSKKFIDKLGCDIHSAGGELKACLRNRDSKTFVRWMAHFWPIVAKFDALNLNTFYPWFDPRVFNATSFIDAMAKADKRTMLFALGSQEDILFGDRDTFPTANASFWPPERNLTSMVPAVDALVATPDRFGNRSIEASEDIVAFYRKTTTFTHNVELQRLIQLFSDIRFNIPLLREAKMWAAAGHNVRFLLFSHVYGHASEYLVEGVRHHNLAYAASYPVAPGGSQIREMLYNFIVYGEVMLGRSRAPKVTPFVVPYITDDAPPFVGTDLWPNRVFFWDTMAKKYSYDVIIDRKVQVK